MEYKYLRLDWPYILECNIKNCSDLGLSLSVSACVNHRMACSITYKTEYFEFPDQKTVKILRAFIDNVI